MKNSKAIKRIILVTAPDRRSALLTLFSDSLFWSLPLIVKNITGKETPDNATDFVIASKIEYLSAQNSSKSIIANSKRRGTMASLIANDN